MPCYARSGRLRFGNVAARPFKITLLVLQAFWMLVILPGHVRGMIVMGERCATVQKAGPVAGSSAASCCAAEKKPFKPGDVPSQQRKERCAVCYQAHGYSLPPVYEFDLTPSGLCELRRLIEPSKLHQLLCRPTYFANGPPESLV